MAPMTMRSLACGGRRCGCSWATISFAYHKGRPAPTMPVSDRAKNPRRDMLPRFILVSSRLALKPEGESSSLRGFVDAYDRRAARGQEQRENRRGFSARKCNSTSAPVVTCYAVAFPEASVMDQPARVPL